MITKVFACFLDNAISSESEEMLLTALENFGTKDILAGNPDEEIHRDKMTLINEEGEFLT